MPLMDVTSADSVKPTGARTPADALGEPKRMNTNESGVQESHECPTCDRLFDTEYGLKQHHAKAHGESIAGVERECEFCGENFRAKPALVDRGDARFCSKSCKGKALSDGSTIEKVCEWCGADFQARQARVDDGEARFCSRDCYGKWQNKPPAERTCDECGDTFSVHQGQLKHRPAEYCSPECVAAKLSRTRTGKDHPNWKGGYPRYYGTSWRSQRQKAVERDGGECLVCGSDDIHVHHIRPFREFGVENHEEANELDNLICLCPTHHGKWEGIPLRPERV